MTKEEIRRPFYDILMLQSGGPFPEEVDPFADAARKLVSRAYEEAIKLTCKLCAQGEEVLHSSLIGYCHNVAMPLPAVSVAGDWHNGKEICPASKIHVLKDSLASSPPPSEPAQREESLQLPR